MRHCCFAGAVADPEPCPWHGTLHSDVAMLVGLANLHGAATLSMDEEWPEGLLEIQSGWFATAIMRWREM